MKNENQEPKISSSLLAEIESANSLVDSALNSVGKLQNFYQNKLENKTNQTNDNDEVTKEPITNKQTPVKSNKPSDWGKMGSQALAESIDIMEEEERELADDTRKVRQVKSKVKKLNIDDNWDDDPF